MTFEQAKQMLPKFAKGLASEAVTISDLKIAIAAEIKLYQLGENPLTENQYYALRDVYFKL